MGTPSSIPRRPRSLPAAALAVLGLVASTTAPTSAADPRDPRILGRWATAGFGSIVELAPCDAAGVSETLCGRILWLWDALDAAGRPRLDDENPEASARRRPLVGVEILRGFRETAPGVWTGGSVYNPDDGRTYSGSIRLQPDGALELEGCALRIFCQRQVWRRPADLLEQAAGAISR
jgi:uncharacterized protein (DUF2147 family)